MAAIPSFSPCGRARRVALLAGALPVLEATAQPFAPSLFAELRWRMIGPFRGGRYGRRVGRSRQHERLLHGAEQRRRLEDDGRGPHVAPGLRRAAHGLDRRARGRRGRARTACGSGAARASSGRTSPSATGCTARTTAGRSWTKLGLEDAQQIAAIAADPKDADRAYVAVLGHPYGANETRGIYRTKDAGKTWEKVLYRDADTGGAAVAVDPKDPDVVYAALWSARLGPWENGEWEGPGTGLYKSTDGGTTWRAIGKGLPGFADGGGRIGFGIAPSDPKRIYATVDGRREEKSEGGIFVSDDAGETFAKVNGEKRLWGRGSDFAEIKVHPWSRDTVWVANTSTYRSKDGGKTFEPVRGAPGGDDFHTIWFHPENPDVILLAADQGVVVSVNGGATWSSWYNQPTAQLYHVSTDDRFPYWVYGGQQESGSAGIASRGDDGAITSRDWHPVAAEEYGYVAPDPKDPDVVYGGKLTRYRHSTKEVQDVSPAPLRGTYRFLRTAPVIFSPADPRLLFYAGNVVFRTADGGRHWDVISPDLSREKPAVPESIGVFRTKDLETMKRRGVVYTLAPAYTDANVIWAGTDDGLIHRTADGGKTWANVTPPSLTPWSKVSMLEASPHDDLTAYAAINRIRLDDMSPHVLRTHDGGKTWTEIVNGLPRRSRQRRPRRSGAEGPPLCGDGTDGLRLVRRRRKLAAPAPQHARDVRARPRREGRRPRDRDARPLLLDPRRRHAAPADDGRRRGGARRISSSRRRPCACGATAGRTRRSPSRSPRARTRRTARSSTTSSARRPRAGADGRPRDPGRGGRPRAPVRERRHARAAGRAARRDAPTGRGPRSSCPRRRGPTAGCGTCGTRRRRRRRASTRSPRSRGARRRSPRARSSCPARTRSRSRWTDARSRGP